MDKAYRSMRLMATRAIPAQVNASGKSVMGTNNDFHNDKQGKMISGARVRFKVKKIIKEANGIMTGAI